MVRSAADVAVIRIYRAPTDRSQQIASLLTRGACSYSTPIVCLCVCVCVDVHQVVVRSLISEWLTERRCYRGWWIQTQAGEAATYVPSRKLETKRKMKDKVKLIKNNQEVHDYK